jgi:hypothetical protein
LRVFTLLQKTGEGVHLSSAFHALQLSTVNLSGLLMRSDFPIDILYVGRYISYRMTIGDAA